MGRNLRRGALLLVGAFVLLPLMATAAGASLNGNCTGMGTFRAHPEAPDEIDGYDGKVINPATTSGPETVPRAASVQWQASIAGTPPPEGRSYSGELVAVIPPILDPILGDAIGLTELWTWGSDSSTSTADADVERYKIPGWVPGGAKIVVAGGHSDELGPCSGTIILRLAGSPLSSPVTIVVIVVTAAGVAIMVSSSIQVVKP